MTDAYEGVGEGPGGHCGGPESPLSTCRAVYQMIWGLIKFPLMITTITVGLAWVSHIILMPSP
jgi:hypothetical protein